MLEGLRISNNEKSSENIAKNFVIKNKCAKCVCMNLGMQKLLLKSKCSFVFVYVFTLLGCLFLLGGCSVNPATGQRQFTALMSPAQEVRVGAQEHEKIIKQFGLYEDQALQNYVQKIGERVTQDTERPDVVYKFFILDTPIINAFALPGGYIYVSRGLMALANSEAELAAVLAHEAGHITGRHSAERFSHGVVASLGTALLSAALDSSGFSQAANLGSELYVKAYSRSQEHEADSLGIRYLSKGGYNTNAMSKFLQSMSADASLQAALQGRSSQDLGAMYFSTHPSTQERVAKTIGEAGQYVQTGKIGKEEYLQKIDGMIYGDSHAQGFVRGRDFYHLPLGFTFKAPPGFNISNQPSEVIASSRTGAIIVFDMAQSTHGKDPVGYIQNAWLKDKRLTGIERVTINGMQAAVAAFPGKVNNKNVEIRVVAISWKDNRMARFQIAVPPGLESAVVEELKRTTYSFRPISQKEKHSIKPYKVKIIKASSRDSVASLARKQPFTSLQEERFRVHNGIFTSAAPGTSDISSGSLYKIIQ